MIPSSHAPAAFAVAGILMVTVCRADPSTGSIDLPKAMAAPAASPVCTAPGGNSPVQGKVPQNILEPIFKEAGALAKIPREQLVIVRAEPVVWNDGSLGCPERGMMYTQALVHGYWVVIRGADNTYDFRVDHAGNFRLCPAGRGRPPFQSHAS